MSLSEGFGDRTVVDLLRRRAEEEGGRLACRFLVDGEDDEERLTYGELERRARAVAAQLAEAGAVGERVLLLYPPGLDYVAAFFGCLYAGATAVPAYPPRPNRPMPRLEAMAADARPVVALTTRELRDGVGARIAEGSALAAVRWLALEPDAAAPEGWRPPPVGAADLAFLQYTSGSTADPKGVMVSHANILHNAACIERRFEATAATRGLLWLPPYHDMGLIGGLLQPLYTGCEMTLLPPVSFLQRPHRWLAAISRFGATASGGPNFAYELCAERVTDEQKAELDLSSWQLAFCGAEPVRPDTLDRFAAAFARCGFDRRAFLACYGLAEGTLMVSAGRHREPPVVGSFDADALRRHRVVPVDGAGNRLVGSGAGLDGQQVAIVDAATATPCAPDRIGEIWVRGGSVAGGYWQRPEATAETFGARLADGSGPFLRTGDLGFLSDGELFVTGRVKDLIIVRGLNHYPQDLEQTLVESHPALRADAGAAFTVERADGGESLVVVQELERTFRDPDCEEIGEAIRGAIAAEHGIEVDDVALVRTASIPKTSSGKVRRHACRREYLAGELKLVGRWTRKRVGDATPAAARPAAGPPAAAAAERAAPDAAEIAGWMARRLSEVLGLDPSQIDPRRAFLEHGLDSARAAAMSAELEDRVGRRLSPTLLWDYPNIEELSRHLAAGVPASPAGRPAAGRPARRRSDAVVAVVGLGCRFPGADGQEAFWRLLADGGDAIGEVPASRWDADALYDPQPGAPGRTCTRWGGFVSGVDLFDADFFGLSPREAERTDPQQRMLLEVAWEALEDAAQAPDRLAGSRTGVFVGVSSNDYGRLQGGAAGDVDAYSCSGNALSITANRLSYVLGLEGPSLAVDTACSSSLVAVHLACGSLRAGECDLALAGGVNLILSPDLTIAFSQARMMAADGRCKTFDAAADGYVRGEGCGVVALKRLADAERDGDRVLGVIRGSAVNQDGRSNGLMAPNGRAQEAVIRAALADAGVEPAAVGYVEAHGTGTPLGDPIEVESLLRIFGAGRPPAQPLALGSVKTNIGHLEAAAGIAGLAKVILALRHGAIPAHLHLREPNPRIAWDEAPLTVPTHLTPWRDGERPRLAGVSSFGFGGTNAHVVVEEAPARGGDGAADEERPFHLYTLSADDPVALAALAARHAAHLAAEPRVPLGDLAFTANTGRARRRERLSVVAAGRDELAAGLEGAASGVVTAASRRGRAPSWPPKVAFLYTGQGAHHPGMGRQLYAGEATFRGVVDRCASALADELDAPLLEVLYGERGARLEETLYAQVALFAVQCGLAALWRSWGLEPGAVLGHSAGEYAAAVSAGVMELDDALRLLAARGRAMGAVAPGGAMASVSAPADQVEAVLRAEPEWGRSLVVAAVNAPSATVISGGEAAVEAARRRLAEAGLRSRRLAVAGAFHSPAMEPAVEPLRRAVEAVALRPPRCRWISPARGEPARDGEVETAAYWVEQLLQPVRFADGVAALGAAGFTAFVEIGPRPSLLALARRCPPAGEAQLWLPSLRPDGEDWRAMLGSLAELWVGGAEVDLAGPDRGRRRHRVALPTYPFQRRRHWVRGGGEAHDAAGLLVASGHPFLGARVVTPLEQALFQATVTAHSLPLVGDHRIAGLPWLNFVLYLELALAGAAAAWGREPRGAAEVEVERGVVLPDGVEKRLHLLLDPPEGDACTFRLLAAAAERGGGPTAAAPTWTLHARGRVLLHAATAGDRGRLGDVALDEVRRRCAEVSDGGELYRAMSEAGAELGPACRWLEEVRRGPGEALGRLRPPRRAEAGDGLYLPLGALDGCFQLLAAALPADAPRDWMLFRLEALEVDGERLRETPADAYWCRALLDRFDHASESARGDLQLLDDAGRVLAAMRGVELRRVGREARLIAAESRGEEDGRRGRRSDLDLDRLRAAASGERRRLVEAYLCEELARALGLTAAEIDRDSPLVVQVDSLMAVELKSRIEVDLGIEVPVAAFFDGHAVGGLAGLVSALLAGEGAEEEVVVAPELEDVLAEIEGLSDEEAEALLAARDPAGGADGEDHGGGPGGGRTAGAVGGTGSDG